MGDLEIRYIGDDDEPEVTVLPTKDEIIAEVSDPNPPEVAAYVRNKNALMSALALGATQPDPYAIHPPFEVIPAPPVPTPTFAEGGTGEGGAEYEVFDESGNAELVDTSKPEGNVFVPNEQLKERMEAQAKEFLHRLKKHNNRQAELAKRKAAKLKKSRKRNKLARAARKRNR